MSFSSGSSPNAVLSDVFRGGAEVGFDDLRALIEAGFRGSAYFFTSRESPELRKKAEEAGAQGITATAGPLMTWLDSLQADLPAL